MMGRVLITGGSSGLGKALVAACHDRGLGPVSVLDVAPAPDAAGGKLDWVLHDMADTRAQSWSALAETLQEQGPFDLVILNAGISATGRFEGIPLATHLAVARVNLLGPMRLVHMLLHAGLLAQGGRVVFISSLSVYTGYPGAASYAASKDGLASLARALRKPLRKAGNISVQLVCPGPMDTPHAARHAPEGARADRRSDPARVARQILELPQGRFVLLPGLGAKLAAVAGTLFPHMMTRIMGKVLFARLK
ncbi:SDR family NAD(P)-dependent oxidoreductase [Roseinatronobacter sp. NSM]|uniref:SDR family NAD(P)-dependent oxidoreductase n=1 Tax=Roseinatronobacter sp. NSM TaxID=3457785 RepID=UPI0040359E88